jgi:hypothetical protein
MARPHPDKFCTPHCFDVSHGIGWCSNVRLDPLERLSTGGLADTHVYKEVATAKLTIKQNPNYLWWL